ncbi:MAG: hypothetical protein H0W58_06785 [Acidobacteria bacterium]|jgi:hypothetical protein|nr:hypothetical protein [Acidobacteriota bacterium]
MSRKRVSRAKQNQSPNRERKPISWRYSLLTLVCGLFLVVGLFGAARQHFSSIEFGIKNSRIRKQITELEAGQRRLILAKEIALAPDEIKKIAKIFGLKETPAINIETLPANFEPQNRPLAEKSNDTKPHQTVKPDIAAVKKELNKPAKEEKVAKKSSKIITKKDTLQKIPVKEQTFTRERLIADKQF